VSAKIPPFIVTAKMTVALSGNSRAIEKKNTDKERISFYSNKLRHRSSMVFPSARSLLYTRTNMEICHFWLISCKLTNIKKQIKPGRAGN
jgi:hypothetical protein